MPLACLTGGNAFPSDALLLSPFIYISTGGRVWCPSLHLFYSIFLSRFRSVAFIILFYIASPCPLFPSFSFLVLALSTFVFPSQEARPSTSNVDSPQSRSTGSSYANSPHSSSAGSPFILTLWPCQVVGSLAAFYSSCTICLLYSSINYYWWCVWWPG